MKIRWILVIAFIILAVGIACIMKENVSVFKQEQALLVDIDKTAKKCLEPDKTKIFSGIIAVVKDGKIIYKYANGYADVENKLLIDEKTNFNLASMSKQFTVMAIMILHERGELNIDDSITKYIPELECKEVTIRNLLSHTGLLPDYMGLAEAEWDKSKPISNEDVIRLFAEHKIKPSRKPGNNFNYSNSGYLLLASIVERVSHQDFQQFMQDNVFEPLEMKTSLSYNLIKNPPIVNRAYGYKDINSGALYDLVYLDGVVGDGSIYSNLEDLLKWDEALKTEKLVKKTTIDMIFTPYALNNGRKTRYGFGWYVDENAAGKVVSHSGSWVGFRSEIIRNLNNNYTIIYLSNVPNGATFEAVEEFAELIKEIGN